MKKRWLIITLVSLLAVACGRQQAEPPVETASPIQVILVSTDFGVGEPRVSFALFDGDDAAENVASVELQVQDLDTAEAIWSGTAVNYSDYTIPYWIFRPTIAEAGFWAVATQLTMDDGTVHTPGFVIEVLDETESLPIGNDAPASETKTVFSEPDLTKLSSGNETNPDLYQMTVAEALETGKPTIVGFITPGLCQTRWCGPTLDSVEEVQQTIGDEANFIHVEVFDDFQELTLVPAMGEWGLLTEPWIFLVDENGRIAEKLGGPVSPRELQEALEPLLP
ncbi:MAG: hypothetical protein AAF614_30060 [Chloroflexota bacterium]